MPKLIRQPDGSVLWDYDVPAVDVEAPKPVAKKSASKPASKES